MPAPHPYRPAPGPPAAAEPPAPAAADDPLPPAVAAALRYLETHAGANPGPAQDEAERVLAAYFADVAAAHANPAR